MAKPRRLRARPDTSAAGLTTTEELEALRAELEELKEDLYGEDEDPDEAPPTGPKTVATWSKKGSLAVAEGKHRWYADEDYEILTVRASVGTAPSGGDVILDVNVNGESIFTNQAERPRIKAGKNTLNERIDAEDIGEPSVEEDEYMTVDVDAANGAADLTVNVVMIEESE